MLLLFFHLAPDQNEDEAESPSEDVSEAGNPPEEQTLVLASPQTTEGESAEVTSNHEILSSDETTTMTAPVAEVKTD